ncbi:hypothetical protein ACET3Z_000686 [Daucus carota]
MSPSNFLSEGGFVPVHKGFFDDNPRPGLKALSVAVKNLDLDGLQGHKEWLVRQQKDVLGSCVFQLLSGYILIYSGGGPCKMGIRRDIDEALGPGIYALIDACSSDDLQLFRSHLTATSDVYSYGVLLLE